MGTDISIATFFSFQVTSPHFIYIVKIKPVLKTGSWWPDLSFMSLIVDFARSALTTEEEFWTVCLSLGARRKEESG